MLLMVQTSPGEFLDKLTILEIKSERITDPAKLANVRLELELVRETWRRAGADTGPLEALIGELRQVNESLWEIEDRIRDKEAAQAFDQDFIELARAVYRTNDRRAAIKRRINQALGSSILEEKSYRGA